MTGPCPHTGEAELGAYADGQLAGAARLWWDDHARLCARCRDQIGRIHALGEALRASLPTSEPSLALREAVRQIIRSPDTSESEPFITPIEAGRLGAAAERGRRPIRWSLHPAWASGIAALLLLGAGFGLGRAVTATGGGGDDVVAQVVDAHVRALQVDHLVDVVSSEHHVVKPWFAGKLDFSPPVPDLAADSFPMVGGRTEYLDGRPVAALVYARGPHRINLFTWPAAGQGGCAQDAPAVRHGFNVVHGRAAGMEFYSISDLNAAELSTFAGDYLREAAKGDPTCAAK
jgi:anti-sigma factor RsiW